MVMDFDDDRRPGGWRGAAAFEAIMVRLFGGDPETDVMVMEEDAPRPSTYPAPDDRRCHEVTVRGARCACYVYVPGGAYCYRHYQQNGCGPVAPPAAVERDDYVD